MTDKKFLVLMVTTAVFMIGIFVEPSRDSPSVARYLIVDTGEFLIAFVAALIGLERAKFFTFKSAIGKALVLISIGLLSWGFGALLWVYYNVIMQIEIPYPSLADIGFLLIIPFVTAGLVLLLKNLKIKFDIVAKLKLVVLPAIIFVLTYLVFIYSKLMEDVSELEKILNVTYPLGDAIFLSLALVIMSLIKGGNLYKPVTIMCLGFVLEAMGDFAFSWTTATGTYFVGSVSDILSGLAFFAIGAGMYYTKSMMNVEAREKRP